ncbi:MAG: NADP-dependent isocitrate dehydrogenase [Anaerolineae bacterium]|nr:NADP-dependent isocitrate dehydrogenase [Anaerolineae bacterium]
MSNPHIVVVRGDGIGPEITGAVLKILHANQTPIEYTELEIGERAYLKGYPTGIPPDTWEIIRAHRVMLKGPITTPQGGGYKSVNVTLRKSLGLYANVRQCRAFAPYVTSLHPTMDVVILRENEEDLYAGIEYRQSQQVVLGLKVVTRPGTESIIRYAFEYARAYGRKKLTCMTKDNIMKMTDGLFHRVFEEVAQEYPDLKTDHMIIDIGAARLAAQPEMLDMIVTLNLYGDILSDIAAQVAGSIGLAGSANVGNDAAMFEAVHGSAPDIADRDIANPSGLLNAAIQMLVHIGLSDDARRIQNAWLKTLEDGIHTLDMYREGISARLVGTRGFADAIIERLGQQPDQLESITYRAGGIHIKPRPLKPQKQALVGADIFLVWDELDRDPQILGKKLDSLDTGPLKFQLMTNRGVKVYPDEGGESVRADMWRCRYLGDEIKYDDILRLLAQINQAGIQVNQVQNLYTFDGERGYSLGQGE